MDKLPLYWTDPEICVTDAVVTSASMINGAWRLELDRTPFYPGGGGQPADRGEINGRTVPGLKKESGIIVHEVSGNEPFIAGERVQCSVDSPFRRDSRQQHTGQHLISAALVQEGLETVSVHLGAEYTGIEVEGKPGTELSDRLVDRVLHTCDTWIRENRKVISRYLNPDEIEDLKLRRSLKEPSIAGSGPVRIVEIDGVDLVGCGGVHLTDTAGVGLILYSGLEKIRGRIRLKWIIGDRAALIARRSYSTEIELGKMFSVESVDIPGRTRILIDENRDLKTSDKKSQKRIGELLAESWITEKSNDDFFAVNLNGGRDMMEGTFDVLSASDLSGAFLLGRTEKGTDLSWCLYLDENHPAEFGNFKKSVLQRFQGKGGGGNGSWRGRVCGKPEEILDAVRQWRSES